MGHFIYNTRKQINMDKLPIYKAIVNSEDSGMVTISLVDFPATESDFLAFDKQKEMVKFSIENEEKRLVRGLVMAADLLIYRYSPSFGEYYIEYDAPTIRAMAEKYLKDGFQNNVDLMHDGNLVEGVNMVQFFIKDSVNGINPKGFEEYADGSLFAEFHINNDSVWEQVKKGNFKGFSLEGFFDIEPTGEQFKEQQNNNDNKEKIMSKVNKLKEMLRAMLQVFGEITTDGGVLIYDGEELEIGLEVHSIDEEGNEIPVEDGEYTTEDGYIITVAEGKIADIQEVEVIVEPEPEAEPEAQENEGEEPMPSEEPDEDEKDAKIAELEAKIAELQAENEELKAKIAELEQEPAAPSAEEAFEKVSAKEDGSKASRMLKKGYKF